MIHAQKPEMTLKNNHRAWPTGKLLPSRRYLKGTSQVVCYALWGWSVSLKETAVPDQLFLARSVRYNQATIQESMSRAKTWLETSPIKRRWINR